MSLPEREVISREILGEWIVEDVVIVDSLKQKLKVIPLTDCGGKGGCGKCNLCGPNDKKVTLSYKIKNSEKYKTGEHIKLRRFIINEAIAAGTVFGIPIIFAFLTQLFWYIISPGTANSGVAVIYTLVAAIVGIGLVNLIENVIKIFFPAQVE